MPAFSIALLGAFDVTLDGQPVTGFAYDKVRGLLAYLAVEADRPHRREHLTALFWPDQERSGALQSLSQALSRLRRVLGDQTAKVPMLSVTPQAIQLNPAGGWRLDVRDFLALIDACHAHAHTRQEGCPACLARLGEAAALYRGTFLAGFSLRDSPAFDEWALFLRERLQRLATEALRDLTAGHTRRGDLGAALAWGQRWLELDPWQEAAHRQVMTVLAASGQRSAALAQYETCRRILAAEFGAAPAPETTALYQRLRSAATPDTPHGPRHNLPTPLAPLIGRTQELAAISRHLLDPGCRLVSLVGPGGSGKTHLAIQAAAQLEDVFAQGVVFAPLAAIAEVPALVPALAQTLGLALTRQEEAHSQLLTFLHDQELLLVLDNFEHLARGAPLLTAMLQAAPHVKILVTTRTRLGLIGEQVIALGGLALPPAPTDPGPGTVQAIADADAVKLFLHHARRIHGDYLPAAADLAAIAQICRAVAGLPLAVLLAATWLDLLPAPAIAHQLLGELAAAGEFGLDFLAADWPDLPPRQRSMRTVLDQSWRLLDVPEQQALAALAVFRGGFTPEAAHATAGAGLRQLRTLVEKSWLHRTATGRYELHELLRQYAEEQLAADPGVAFSTRSRHCAFFAAALAQWCAELRSGRQLAALTALTADLENARTAWHWAVSQARLDAIGQALEGLCLYCDWRGLCQQGEELCQAAVEQLTPRVHHVGCLELARLLAWHGWFSQALDHLDAATARLYTCLAILDEQAVAEEGRRVRAFALYALGHAVHGIDRAAARRHWEASLALYRGLADAWGSAQVLSRLGMMARDRSDFPAARQLLEESLALSRAAGDEKSLAYALGQLVSVYANQGEFATAVALGQQSIALSQALGDPLGAAECMGGMAGAMAYSGHLAEAAALFAQATAIFAEHGARHAQAYGLHMSGWVSLNLGHYALARQQYQAAQAIMQERNHRHGLALSALGLGETALVTEEYEQARLLLVDGVARFAEVQQWDEQAITLATLAVALRGLGRREEARQCVAQALQLALPRNAFAPLLFALDAFALVLADEGDLARALELSTLVGQHAYLKDSRWRQERCARHILARTNALAPAAQAAAVARGQQEDLHTVALAVLTELAPAPPA